MVQALPFSPPVQRWFADSFEAATAVQLQGWPAIAGGEHALLCAPTGSGKTLAAFLWCIDTLTARPAPEPPGWRVVYLSPLKALAYDVERNLRAPLAGVLRASEVMGTPRRSLQVDLRTGDTPQKERSRMGRRPGDVLITTPESLYLMLGSRVREHLANVETVIVDEIHALAPNKRGAHLALSLERLSVLAGDPQRIGLSATQRPLSEVARYLGGDRPVRIVDTSQPPDIALSVVVPVPDMERPVARDVKGRSGPLMGAEELGSEERRSIWPSIHPLLLERIRTATSTIVFTNSRLLCERLCQSLNELAGTEIARAHHGSIARPQRVQIEEMLKAGELPAIVATSSLELGIDMGAVDQVLLVESPGSVARGLQRIGRAGHQVGERSVGRIFPKYKGDLLEATVVARRMLAGDIEPMKVPRNCLDVLAQQLVALCAQPGWVLDDLEALVKRAYGYAEISRELLVAVLDMLAGRYPSQAFSELRPRLLWDRDTDVLETRKDGARIALINGGTIPDRGLYTVVSGQGGARIGELDEEMVFETRVGQTIILGASSWRVDEITRDRVVVSPAPGEPGRLPFWRGQGPGRPVELGRAMGAFVRDLGDQAPDEAESWLIEHWQLDALAAANLAGYVAEQHASTGSLPTDRCVVVERFRDELGDWRVCIHSAFGARVNAPWCLAVEAHLARQQGFEVQSLYTDDGISLRFADVEELPPLDDLLPDPDELEDLIVEQLSDSAVFASTFRECAARALLLPRKMPGKRTPLWAQRLRAQNLLAVVRDYPAFPIVLETYRECLQDLFDLPALVELLGAVRRRDIRVVEVETPSPSPFARNLVFAYVAAFLYEGDAPLAERRAQALTLDRSLLRELLGQDELRELIDPEVADELEAELQSVAPGFQVRTVDGASDLLRRLGELSLDELVARCDGDAQAWLAELEARRRVVRVRVAGRERLIAVEDSGRYRDALGSVPPAGVPAAFLEPVELPLEDLVLRFARTHAPFRADRVAERWGLLPSQVEAVLRGLEARGSLVNGLSKGEWADSQVLRRLKRRCLAALRNEIAPVEDAALGRFLPGWHGIGFSRGGLDRLDEAVEQLEGLAVPFSVLEERLLPARLRHYEPSMLDELGASGELVWVGCGALGPGDGKIALYRRERVAALLEPPEVPDDLSADARSLLVELDAIGACFFAELRGVAGLEGQPLLDALWDLVWAGLVTNDTFHPLRALRLRGRASGRRRRTRGVGGRWSLVASLLRRPAPPTERAWARVRLLLERYGVVGREIVKAEGVAGGFSALYPVLRAMEESGKVRRGHFVEGVQGAQFAVPGAVDRLRACRVVPEAPEAVVVDATDPANPWGAALPWPDTALGAGRPRRVGGATVVLVDGLPLLFLERGGRAGLIFSAFLDPRAAQEGLRALRTWISRSPKGQLHIERLDGRPAREHPAAAAFRELGFSGGHRGLMLEVL